MISKEELIEIIKEKESNNHKFFEKIYISNTWYSPNQVKDNCGNYIFKTKGKEKGWFVYIFRTEISGWACCCDYWIVYDKDNIIEEIDYDLRPMDINLEEINYRK